MTTENLKNIIEAILLTASEPMSVQQLVQLFDVADAVRPEAQQIRQVIQELQQDYQARGMELQQVAGGYRFQVRQEYAHWVGRLWQQKPPRYSRALLETLAIIAYRQPITRAEIEDIRGVVVSTNITRTLQDRDWVKVVGHRDVPGKPAMFGTTKTFLDYFNLMRLEDLPTLADLPDISNIHPELELSIEPENKV